MPTKLILQLVTTLPCILAQFPEVFIHESRNRDTFSEPDRGPITINCNTTGRVVQDIVWKKNDQLLRLDNFVTVTFSFSASNLIIRNFDALVGDYTCTVIDAIGVFSSRTLRLQKTFLNVKYFSTQLEDADSYIFQEGIPDFLSCGTYQGIALTRFITVWNTYTGQPTPGPLPTSVKVTEDGRLFFPEPTPKDAGVYICRIKSLSSDVEVLSGNGFVRVTIIERVQPPFPLTIWISPKSQDVILGDSATFSCYLGGMGAANASTQWSYPPNARPILGQYNLTIPMVTHESLGVYTCNVGDSSISANLTLINPPVISSSFPKFIRNHSRITLLCFTLVPNSAVSLQWEWFFNGSKISHTSSPVPYASKVVIDSFTDQNKGIYQCIAKNRAGYSMSAGSLKITSNLPHLPEVDIQLSSNRSVFKDGENVAIHCNISKGNMYHIFWKMNNTAIKANENYVITTSGLQSDLAIISFGAHLAGEYICVFEDVRGFNVSSRSLRLQRAIFDVLYQESSFDNPFNFPIHRGRPLFLDCSFLYQSVPKAKVEWNTAISSTEVGPIDPNIARPIPANGQLYFFDGSNKSEGIYRCYIYNDLFKPEKYTFFKIQQSRYSFEGPIRAYFFPINQRKRSVIIGQFTTISCYKSGVGADAITEQWTYPDNVEPNIVNGYELQFIVQPGYDGVYSCTVGDSTVSITLEILKHPNISSKFSSITLQYNSNVTLTCSSSEPTEIEWEWYFNGNRINATVKNFQFSTVYLEKVNDQNKGIYQCIGSNLVGYSVSYSYIEIRGPGAYIGDSLPSTTYVVAGKPLVLHCDGHGDPPLSFSWQKLTGSTNIFLNYSNVNGTLMISKTTLQHSGVYECRVQNIVKGLLILDNRTVEIIVIAATIAQNPLEAQLGSKVELPCSSSDFISSSVSIQWKRNDILLMNDDQIRLLRSLQGVTLVIESVSLSHEGQYQCIASIGSSSVVISTTNLTATAYLPTPVITRLNMTSMANLLIVWSYKGDIRNFTQYSVQLRSAGNWITLRNGQITSIQMTTMATYSSFESVTDYSVRIIVSNQEGQTVTSALRAFRTTVAVPDGPPTNVKVKQIDTSSILISWKPPIKPNGPIINYAIVSTDNTMATRHTVSGTKESYTLNDLATRTRYLIKVAAATSAGYGPFSQEIKVMLSKSIHAMQSKTLITSIIIILLVLILPL